jgi:hypothetical protein
VIPEGVISIGMSAFGYCRNLLEITLPDSLKNIEKGILDSCTRLKKIRCIKGSYAEQYVIENSLGKLIEYIKDDGYYNNKIANMSSAVLTKGDIEKYIKDNNISGPFSFIAPEGCKIIDDEAFYECKLLKSIVIPNSVEYIGERAFYNCTALVNINIPENLSSIGSHAFFTCESLTGITLPNSITEIEKGIFLWCRSLTELALPSSVKKIGDEAFHSCASLRITIPNSVEIIGEKALNLYGDKDGILYGFKRINELGRQISGKQYAEAKVICKKGSYVEKYMLENSLRELIEYM